MIHKMLPRFSAALFLFVSLVAKFHVLQFQNVMRCGDIEIYTLQPNHSLENICDCCLRNQCSWSMFVDRGDTLSNGSVLKWQKTGYGQYICVRDDSTVACNILILPESKEIGD